MKLNARISLIVLTALAAALAVKLLALPASSVAARPADTTPVRTSTADVAPRTIAIVPAQVIDRSAEIFAGTGDASSGSWVRP